MAYLELFIDALAIINDITISWKHIGYGMLFDEIKKYAEEKLGPKSNIDFKFLGGMSNQDVYGFYNGECVDLFINVSRSEGLPVSIMEACSFGIPIIATNVGGSSELVSSVNGVLLPGEIGAKDIADAIKKILILDEKEIDVLKQGAFDVWESKYNAGNNYKNFVQYILNIDGS